VSEHENHSQLQRKHLSHSLTHSQTFAKAETAVPDDAVVVVVEVVLEECGIGVGDVTVADVAVGVAVGVCVAGVAVVVRGVEGVRVFVFGVNRIWR